ncbi:MAG: Na+/H+ antiporter NhaC family protein [Planctomycetes bacterium]|nr:Na+/H+ antiporter NhaC family protein [Planctomycetota bacterium]
MPEHPYGPLSLLPPLVAILLAIATRRVVIPLMLGIFAGALILEGWNPHLAVAAFFEDHLWRSLTAEGHLRVFTFTLLMGATVGVIHASGGMHGVVNALAPLARNRRSGQLTTWVLGLIVFFDDYANTLLLGGTMRPLADRLKISREKLAYLVDSTAAPVAGLALVSTWVAVEVGYINEGFAELPSGGVQVDGFAIFIATIPYRFYVLWALALVALVAVLRRDFGPMLAAERRAQDGSGLLCEDASVNRHKLVEPDDAIPQRWHNAVVPVTVVVSVAFCLLVATGAKKVAADPTIEPSFFNYFANGDSYVALVYGSLAGLLSAIGWIGAQGIMSRPQFQTAALRGARQMLGALVILWLAWALSAMTREGDGCLQTGIYLSELLEQRVAAAWLPTIAFVLSSLVAFATGTSYGTMGILMPLVIRVTHQLLASDGTSSVVALDPIMTASIGGVLAGAIFGDHCSPISDTTILSSQASGCDHLEHVRTQLPYALLVGAVSILFGTLPVGFGVSPWLMLPLGIVALAVFLLLFGKRV